ncbi:MAG: MotA/TolQ/ExbB proton channel family protein [Planctomycetia bacterium]|nr:MotA/TolQ/ExbB proton channel family protein [Planctomycetia bacterium]
MQTGVVDVWLAAVRRAWIAVGPGVLGRILVAAVLAGAAVGPAAVWPGTTQAQDEEAAGDEAAADEGESMLVFYYNALGIKYVIVFLALSFGLVALLVMCFLQVRKAVLMPPGLSQAFEAHLDAKEYQPAYELAKNDDSYLGQVLAAGMGKLQSGYGAAVEALQAEEGEQAMKLEHKISYVSLIGALAPMFGLLGTVDGMVASFMIIAKSATAPKPNELAIGISQALITTLIGLWLAIPAIACFALFKNWLQKLNGDVDTEAMRLMSRFQNMGKK